MYASSQLKKIVVLLAVLVFTLSSTSAGQAKVPHAAEASPPQAGGTVWIVAAQSNPVVVGAGQKAKIFFLYDGCSKGLVTDGIKSIRGKYVLKKSNGKIIETHKMKPSKWGGYSSRSSALCIWPADSAWDKVYKSPALTLAKSGTYTLEVLIWFKEPVLHGFGTSWPVPYHAAGTRFDHTITITKN